MGKTAKANKLVDWFKSHYEDAHSSGNFAAQREDNMAAGRDEDAGSLQEEDIQYELNANFPGAESEIVSTALALILNESLQWIKKQ